MEKLNKKEWYRWSNWVKDVANRYHEEWEVEKVLAKLWYTLSVMTLFELPVLIWRTHKLRQAVKHHKNCCDLD